ncbi:hypothetical protein TNCV_4261781 [Trichonephila clavipes]|nr:hypothetical protein TNCV_4261781 [Trichonephila clavipes]
MGIHDNRLCHKCYLRLYSPKNLEFRTICQLATCDDRRLRTGLDLPPYTIITHAVSPVGLYDCKSGKFICSGLLFVRVLDNVRSMYYLPLRVIGGVYICVRAQGLKKSPEEEIEMLMALILNKKIRIIIFILFRMNVWGAMSFSSAFL